MVGEIPAHMNECTRKINKKGDQNNWIENLEIDHETYNLVFGLSYLDLVESLNIAGHLADLNS